MLLLLCRRLTDPLDRIFKILLRNPGVAEQYLAVCAHNEHFMEYRQIVRDQIEAQLAEIQAQSEDEPITDSQGVVSSV